HVVETTRRAEHCFAQYRTIGVIADKGCPVELLSQDRLEGHVVPSRQVRAEVDDAELWVKRTRRDDANSDVWWWILMRDDFADQARDAVDHELRAGLRQGRAADIVTDRAVSCDQGSTDVCPTEINGN